jgi:hypothetical protein
MPSKRPRRNTRRKNFRKNQRYKKRGAGNRKIARIAKAVVKNNTEMLRRESGILNVQYLDGNLDDGPPTTVYKGLNTRGPFNFILNPLNYGWENDDSSDTLDHFTGKGIHPRYLKTRLKFNFPGGDQSIKDPMRLQLVWGFVKRPAMLTKYTTPTASEVTKNQYSDLFLHQVEPEFDNKTDQMKFQVKRPNNYVITGKKWLKPDRRFRIGMPQQSSWVADGSSALPSIIGSPPEIIETISWKMGRQWRLQKSTSDEYESDIFWYNNEQWAPFMVVFNPDYCNVKQAEGATCGGGEDDNPVPEPNRIQCQHNSCMWYTDA